MLKSLLVILIVFTGGASAEEEAAMDRAIELRFEQDGFAGTTGTAVRIDADGRWSAHEFAGEMRLEGGAEGRLTRAQMDELAALLPDGGAGPLGEGGAVNAARLVLVEGAREWALPLPPGAEEIAPCGAGDGDAACALRRTAIWVRAHVLE